MNVIGRAEWGARHGRGNVMPVRMVDTLVVHHDGIDRLTPDSTFSQDAEVIRIFEEYHAKKLTPDNPRIAYTFIIPPSARIFEGCGWGRVGAHTGGHNSKTYGVCFAQNGAVTPLTSAQLVSLRQLRLDGVRNGYLSAKHSVKGHQDYNKPDCPGKLIYEAAVLSSKVLDDLTKPKVVWSNYFGDWLIVTRVVNDREWYFVPSRNLKRLEIRASELLSRMPEQP